MSVKLVELVPTVLLKRLRLFSDPLLEVAFSARLTVPVLTT
ncbi:hypothetical protein [Bradyrhizobium sp. 6(2017)]